MPSSSFQWSIKNAFTTAFALECQLWVFCGSAPAQTVVGPIREQCALTSSWLQNADWIILVYLRSNYGCEYFYGLEKDSWGVRVWEWGVSALDAINRIKNGACIYAKKMSVLATRFHLATRSIVNSNYFQESYDCQISRRSRTIFVFLISGYLYTKVGFWCVEVL